MRRFSFIVLAVVLFGVLASAVRGETFELTDGTSVTGEMILPANAEGLNIKLPSGQYQRVPWDKFSQESLRELAKNPRLVPFVETLIEEPEEERLKRTEIDIQPVERLERPADASLIGGLFHSGVGLFALLLIYAANIYAGYEVALVRAFPPLTVCGASAVLPIIGPIVFLCMPTRVPSVEQKTSAEAAVKAATQAEVQREIAAATAPESGLRLSAAAHDESGSEIPETQVFQRGKTMFNRRFFETKFSGFFGVVRREKEKDMQMIVKTARGEFVATRISRISTNEMHLEVVRGGAGQEVAVPFAEVQEVQLKHKDAS